MPIGAKAQRESVFSSLYTRFRAVSSQGATLHDAPWGQTVQQLDFPGRASNQPSALFQTCPTGRGRKGPISRQRKPPIRHTTSSKIRHMYGPSHKSPKR